MRFIFILTPTSPINPSRSAIRFLLSFLLGLRILPLRINGNIPLPTDRNPFRTSRGFLTRLQNLSLRLINRSKLNILPLFRNQSREFIFRDNIAEFILVYDFFVTEMAAFGSGCGFDFVCRGGFGYTCFICGDVFFVGWGLWGLAFFFVLVVDGLGCVDGDNAAYCGSLCSDGCKWFLVI